MGLTIKEQVRLGYSELCCHRTMERDDKQIRSVAGPRNQINQ